MPPHSDAAAVRQQLGLDESYAGWTEALQTVAEPPAAGAGLPEGDDLTALLRALGVPERENAEIAGVLPELTAPGSAFRWLFDRAVARVAAGTGAPGWGDAGPGLPGALGAAGRWFHFAVFLGCVPSVRAYHAKLGIPDDVSWASLSDLGDKVAVHRRTYGTGGMDKQSWMTLPYRGILYRLGRLQFNLDRHPDGGGPGVEVHIPEDGGPITPELCEESYARAAEFFPRYFGEFFGDVAALRAEGLRMSCRSWLLDPQLAEYLPAGSNILRFQRRYAAVEEPKEPEPAAAVNEGGLSRGDRGIVEFVFRRVVTSPAEVAALSARTTLERAVVAHIAAGRHWNAPLGVTTTRPAD